MFLRSSDEDTQCLTKEYTDTQIRSESRLAALKGPPWPLICTNVSMSLYTLHFVVQGAFLATAVAAGLGKMQFCAYSSTAATAGWLIPARRSARRRHHGMMSVCIIAENMVNFGKEIRW